MTTTTCTKLNTITELATCIIMALSNVALHAMGALIQGRRQDY